MPAATKSSGVGASVGALSGAVGDAAALGSGPAVGPAVGPALGASSLQPPSSSSPAATTTATVRTRPSCPKPRGAVALRALRPDHGPGWLARMVGWTRASRPPRTRPAGPPRRRPVRHHGRGTTDPPRLLVRAALRPGQPGVRPA